jgi:hypothetical protein
MGNRSGSLTAGRSVPLKCLPGNRRNAFEVPVTVQKGQTLEFRRSGNDQIDGAGAATPASLGQYVLDLPGAVVGAVVDRYPSEEQWECISGLSWKLRRSRTPDR